jgi:RNA polymerase sigma-70 factor (ECF subfamily)
LYDALWLQSTISRLKPAYRETAVLVAWQQLTHAEAAEVLGVAEATVSWRMGEVRRDAVGGGRTDGLPQNKSSPSQGKSLSRRVQ